MPEKIYNEAQLSSYVETIFKRLERIEEQIGLLSAQAGIPWEDAAGDVPKEVVELARSGDRMGAIKRYRELTDAPADLAQEVVSGL